MGLITIEYCKTEHHITIIGIQGRTAILHIPQTIEGLPVTEIADFAFAIKEEVAQTTPKPTQIQLQYVTQQRTKPADTQTGEPLQEVYLPDTITKIGAYAFGGCSALTIIHLPEHLDTLSDHIFSGCTSLENITLPETLKIIAGYAFYDCRNLKKLVLPETVTQVGKYACYNCRTLETINIPKATENLGTGLFLNCDKLKYISFGRCRHIADLIAVLNHELHLTIEFDDNQKAKLLIPDFQYEYIEDTPARQFHQVNYGTGHLFRQCIGNSDIDFRRFDELFYLTKREDGAFMVLFLSVYRLEYPYRLQENRRQAYLQYLQEHFSWAFGYYTQKNDLHTIRLFAQWGLVTAENIENLLQISAKYKRTEITSYVLDYQQKYLKPKQKSFDL